MRSARFQFICWLVAVLTGVAGTALSQPETFAGNPNSSAFIWIPRNTDDWTRHFHIGAVLGLNISAKFSMNGTFNISGNNPAQGIYDDGYVRVDSSGDNGGGTTYWGYDNASQYNGQTLTMHATTSFSTSSSASDNGGPFPGFDMAYGENLWYWKHARVGWELGFDLLPINITDNHPISATINRFTYAYNVGNVVIPGAPYYGNSSGSSAMIPNTPPTVSSQPLSDQIISGTRSLDLMLYSVRLGPSFYWDLSEKVGMSLGAGPAIGIVSGDYKYDETITVGDTSTHNAGQFGATDMVYGGYVNAMVMYHAVENGDIYAGVQYMPMTDANFSSGGRDGRLNLNGQIYFTVGINWPF